MVLVADLCILSRPIIAHSFNCKNQARAAISVVRIFDDFKTNKNKIIWSGLSFVPCGAPTLIPIKENLIS